MAKKKKIVKYKKPKEINIGIIIFAVVLIYMLIKLITYFSSKPVAVYEVQQGTISNNKVYRGLIIRDEKVVKANKSGYVNYYAKNGSKVSVTDNVYSVDTDGGLSKKISKVTENADSLTSSDISNISTDVDGFVSAYTAENFQDVDSFRTELSSELTQILGANALGKLVKDVEKAASNNTFFLMNAETPGVIMYSIDGYENKNIDDFSPSWFDSSKYNKAVFSSCKKVKKGDPVYKLITEDAWDVVISINSKTAQNLKNTQSVKVRFCKDNKTSIAQCSIISKKHNKYYLKLSFTDSMIRYASDRFLDIELLNGGNGGLKIPTSSLTSKNVYCIPKKFFFAEKNNGKLGITLEHTDKKLEYIKPNIIFSDDSNYYISKKGIKTGDIVVDNDSQETCNVNEKLTKLDGVYCINKGYAVFKPIKIIVKNQDYVIAEKLDSYSITLYDHIALDGDSTKENEIVTK